MKVFADLQTRVVHLLRHSLTYAGWKERKAFAAALRPIYTAASAEAAEAALTATEAGPWGRRFPTVFAAWRRAWVHGTSVLCLPPPDIRRTLYTTNALENVNRQIRKVTKTRGQFPNDDAALKLIWLAVRNLTARWTRGEPHWKPAMGGLAPPNGPSRAIQKSADPQPHHPAIAIRSPRSAIRPIPILNRSILNPQFTRAFNFFRGLHGESPGVSARVE